MGSYHKYLKSHTFSNDIYYSATDVHKLLNDIREKITKSPDIYKDREGVTCSTIHRGSSGEDPVQTVSRDRDDRDALTA